MIDFSERAPKVAEALVAELEPKLQKAVLDADWEHGIDLTSDSGEILLSYDEDHMDGLFTAEYGPEGGAPRAVIRPFLRDSSETIKQAVETEAIDFLFSAGILP